MPPFAAQGQLLGTKAPLTPQKPCFGSVPRFPVSVLLGWHYNNKHKTTTDLIHLNPKKHIHKKSPLPLPTAHAFSNFIHTSSGHAAIREDFSGCERLGSYNNSNTEGEYDDVDNN